MRTLRRLALSRAGSTLVELIVAAAIMSVGILGLFGAFRYITRSIFVSRGQTLATNLAQERIEYLKNINYYALLITTASAVDNDFTPGLAYDTVNYPPEAITIAGITYTRYTHVAMGQVDDNVISTVTYNYPDTGMKQMAVHVVWTDNGVRKKWTLRNLLENPYVNPLDATITGTISNAAGGVVAGTLVSVEQNPDWNATTDASGNYNFKVYHGTYSVRASSSGFYDSVSPSAVVARGGSKNIPLTLTQIATGSVAGIVWYNDDLVVSQVVAATRTFVADGNEADVEYIELFNPTTYPIDIAAGGTGSGTTSAEKTTVWYWDDVGANQYLFWDDGATWSPEHVVYSTYVPAQSYYLIANSSYFCVNNTWARADAVYYDSVNPDYPDFIGNDRSGTIQIYHPYKSPYYGDKVGWADNDSVGSWEGAGSSYIIDIGAGNDGLGTPKGKQFVRVSSPGINANDLPTYGRAYDSGYNNRDWLYTYAGSPSFFYTPYSVATGSFPVIAGKPAHWTNIAASDYLSGSTQSVSAFITSGTLSLPYSPFVLPGVSTGTWDVAFASGSHNKVLSTVVVQQNVVTSVPNAATSPSWTVAGRYHVPLDSATVMGFVKGQVRVSNSPIANIQVEGGGNSKLTGANGMYFMPVSSGTFNLVANPNNANSAYIQDIRQVTVSSGTITTQDFSLSLGGRIQGYATSGTTPLANIVFTALQGGSQVGSGTTDATGVFNIRNVSTGTYTVQPVLEVGQDTNPNNPTVVLTTTGTVFVATFTISGAFGNIGGTVSDASGLVTSGALVIASTSSIPATPPSIAGSSAPAMTPYYMVSSKADGTYTMPVRGASTYYVSVYVPVIAGASVTITTKTYSGVYVTPSLTTTRDVTIP